MAWTPWKFHDANARLLYQGNETLEIDYIRCLQFGDFLSTPGSGYVAKADASRELADAVRAVAGGTSFVSASLKH